MKNNIKTEITFLGTGTSGGVPEIGCDCSVCTSDNPKNKRLRTSVFLKFKKGNDKLNILIDTTPDFRQQCLSNKIKRIDAVLYTHNHYDHICGLDELRRFNFLQKSIIPIYADDVVLRFIKKCYSYIFNPIQIGGGVPQVELNEVKYYKEFSVEFVNIMPLLVYHGKLKIVGFRFNDFAYITDASFLPDKTMKQLSNLKLLILNALRYEPHETHFNLEQAVGVVRRVNPQKAFFVHLTHKFDYDKTNSELPDNIRLAYDGLTVYV